jgi:hypothetical protein
MQQPVTFLDVVPYVDIALFLGLPFCLLMIVVVQELLEGRPSRRPFL